METELQNQEGTRTQDISRQPTPPSRIACATTSATFSRRSSVQSPLWKGLAGERVGAGIPPNPLVGYSDAIESEVPLSCGNHDFLPQREPQELRAAANTRAVAGCRRRWCAAQVGTRPSYPRKP